MEQSETLMNASTMTLYGYACGETFQGDLVLCEKYTVILSVKVVIYFES